ncbi:sensor histidine kinase [Kitasatospora sp. NPDC127059]|uniref:sensor histidine kinase n=1 Tax=unclassified Kitasatospora TaxID=2633591 RepID=UPI00364D10AF
MPGISAPRTGHRAGRSGSLRSSLLALVLVPSLGLAAAWGYAAYLLRDAGHRTALTAGTAVVALVLLVSLVRGVRAARALSARLAALRTDTLALAQREIPGVVGRLRAGEPVPTPPTWTPSRRTGDEVQQTSDGLAAVRQAAVAAIVHQAQGREGTKKVFLNIARRTQILIHRQISMLDALEREHEEPELLRELFAVDHLATRMRRNAENLVILGGALPARRWRNAVPVVNVLRSAVSETENYARVVVQGVPRASLSGQAVADVIHLVAELIENGTTFSPPYTQVQVSAQEVPKGLAVEVEDRGLGMTEDEYERLNEYLANPPELDVSALGDDLRLGLFVVARLAARHDIQVTLRPSPYGGTRAVVLVPAVLLEQAEQPAAVPGLPSGARVTRTPVPEPRSSGGDFDAVDEELTGALAGVLSGLTGGAPADDAGAGAPGAADGGLIIGELLARKDGEGDGALPDDAGLPVGAQIPGLPGAVVVPRPALPRPYDLPTGPSAELAAQLGAVHGSDGALASDGADGADGALASDGADGSPAAHASHASRASNGSSVEHAADAAGDVAADLAAGLPADVAPSHERPQEDHVEHGPDGELRTPRVLPQRVRNASLAEQLREANAPGALMSPAAPAPSLSPSPRSAPPSASAPYGAPAAPTGPRFGEADDPSPARSRATMAAIQRGTRSARAAGTGPDAPAIAPNPAAASAPGEAAEASAVQEAKEQQ